MGCKLKGVFVNPALTEPFGLTLLEASSCGLPIISTNDGGPKICSKCENGLLVDVTDINQLKDILEEEFLMIISKIMEQKWN